MFLQKMIIAGIMPPMLFDEIKSDHKKLLDEIRMRAEEAELARIEAQEIQLRDQLSEMISAIPLPPPPGKNVVAVENIQEQSTSAPVVIEQLKTEAKQPDERIAGLLQSANTLYQNEKYNDSLGLLTEALSLDAQNAQALALKAEVERAVELMGRLQQDVRKKQEESETEKQHSFPLPRKTADENVSKQEDPFVEPVIRPAVSTSDPKPGSSAKRKIPNPLKWFAFAGLAVLGILTAIVLFQNVRERFFLPTKSLLVLPVYSAGAPPYLVESMTGELITQLSQIKTLHVFGTKTALALGSKERDAAQNIVKAEFFLELDLEQGGEPLTLRFNLVKAATSSPVFSRRITVSQNKLATFWGDIIPDLTKAMDAENENPKSLFLSSSTNGKAFDLYLRGRYLLEHPELASTDSVIRIFELSRTQEPTFAGAEVALGWSHILRYKASHDTSRSDLTEANKNLQRAVNLGAKNSEVYTLWGWIEYSRSNFENAVERFQQAVALSPSDGEAYRGLSFAYVRLGKSDEALDAASVAAAVDPFNSDLRRHFAMLLRSQRRNTEALQEFEATIRIDSDSTVVYGDAFLGCLLATNHPERAIDILKERAQKHPRNFIVFYDLGRALQLAGKSQVEWKGALHRSLDIITDTLKIFPAFALAHSYRGLAQTRLGLFSEGYISASRAVELAPSDVSTLYNSARIYALQRGKSVEALTLLSKAINRRFELETLLDPDLMNLHPHPKFKALLGI